MSHIECRLNLFAITKVVQFVQIWGKGGGRYIGQNPEEQRLFFVTSSLIGRCLCERLIMLHISHTLRSLISIRQLFFCCFELSALVLVTRDVKRGAQHPLPPFFRMYTGVDRVLLIH